MVQISGLSPMYDYEFHPQTVRLPAAINDVICIQTVTGSGWFVTHGGHNGVVYAICASGPMIRWTFAFGQPLNAMYLTQNPNVAYEVFNVRTGPNLKPVYRFDKAPEGTLNVVRGSRGGPASRFR
ncbi:uncharacterized protein C8Q71DRAFT_777031 [Rhodofomes roseus]|uniref:Uncharacterized protein n=1 Tax=Rhodofomes roseus TaxID=34475 RepID=A0ABQ8K707_9APHY|nr:uncharacterized protein C8Q71DRAFT_777031 [Rhodofomes roseus]KAH9832557.1 hypothetical protein C8Q71DRAFT_777031 [Rhodofomes roseus]